MIRAVRWFCGVPLVIAILIPRDATAETSGTTLPAPGALVDSPIFRPVYPTPPGSCPPVDLFPGAPIPGALVTGTIPVTACVGVCGPRTGRLNYEAALTYCVDEITRLTGQAQRCATAPDPTAQIDRATAIRALPFSDRPNVARLEGALAVGAIAVGATYVAIRAR